MPCRFGLAVAAMLFASAASAATYEVSSIPDLQAAIDNAAAGDTIVVHNGAYTASASITVNRQGTAREEMTHVVHRRAPRCCRATATKISRSVIRCASIDAPGNAAAILRSDSGAR
jgi:hypothetical protein